MDSELWQGLKKAEKVFIVRSLAQFMTPTEVVVAIKENFKIDVSPQQVESYDPTKTAGADISQELVDLFHEARQKYIDQPIYNIIGANDIIQLQILSDLLVSKKGNVVMSIKLIDQIQKIVKGHYERKLEITGKDGGAIKTETEHSQRSAMYTPEQLAGMSAQELSRLAINGKL